MRFNDALVVSTIEQAVVLGDHVLDFSFRKADPLLTTLRSLENRVGARLNKLRPFQAVDHSRHVASFACVVACHASIISIVSSSVKLLRHLFGEN